MTNGQPHLPNVASHEGPNSSEFERFHRDHPQVYMLLVALAREAVHRKMPATFRTLWEVCRFNLFGAPEGAVLDDSMMPLYSREIMRRERDLDGLFRTRVLRRDKRAGRGRNQR